MKSRVPLDMLGALSKVEGQGLESRGKDLTRRRGDTESEISGAFAFLLDSDF
jgi:hypothetical protein